jgi:hypothetical protein
VTAPRATSAACSAAVPAISQLAQQFATVASDDIKPLEEAPRLKTEIERLNLVLANAEPLSAHAAAIQADIQVLEAWSAKVQGRINFVGRAVEPATLR